MSVLVGDYDEVAEQIAQDEAADAAYEEYCCRPFPVQCKQCGVVKYATQHELEKTGWLLTRNGTWCPQHARR